METPNYWEFEEIEDSAIESSAQATAKGKDKPSSSTKNIFSEKSLESAQIHKSKSELATLEDAAKKFPSFILPSLQKAHFVREQTKYPRIEEDLFATSSTGYVLDLEKSRNPAESIRVWIGSLYQMQVISKLNNESIFILLRKEWLALFMTGG